MMKFITVLIMEVLGGAEVAIFVPSFPEIQKDFGVSPFMVELLLGLNFIAHCIFSLIVGNLGDRFGHKPIIIIGLIVFIIGSILCVYATIYEILLVGRFLQGVGVSGPAVLAYIIIADMYSTAKQQQIMSVLNGTITLAMAAAPVLGSYIALFFGWRGNFTILLILGAISLVFCFIFIPGGHKNRAVKISIKEYVPILKSAKAIWYIVCICLLIQSYWVFIGISPILYIDGLGVTLDKFGFYQGTMAFVFSVFSFSSGYFIAKMGIKNCIIVSGVFLGFFIFASCLLIIYQVSNPNVITAVMQLLAIGVIFPVNIMWPLALETVPDAKCRLAAALTSLRLITTATTIQVVIYFYQGSFKPLGIAMSFTLILSFLCFYFLLQKENIFLKRKEDELPNSPDI